MFILSYSVFLEVLRHQLEVNNTIWLDSTTQNVFRLEKEPHKIYFLTTNCLLFDWKINLNITNINLLPSFWSSKLSWGIIHDM